MNNGGITSPLDITPRMSNSNSPRGQTSNLTSALQEAGVNGNLNNAHPQYLQQLDYYNGNGQSADMMRNDSINNMFGGSYYGNGAKPILMGNRQRRESNNAGSYMGGMSWGAGSINGGDWVRDDVMMVGTSPSAFQQPSSFQSSSYLPKMEASFFKDYWCCNKCHASLHDLMEHMESAHGGQSANMIPPQTVAPSALNFNRQPSLQTPQPTHRAPASGQTSQPQNAQVTKGFQTSAGPSKSILATIHDDPLDTMDFDEPHNAGMSQAGLPNTSMSQQPFRSQTAAAATASQPFSLLSSNPTVSSVNTPTLSTHPLAHAKHTPDSSIPSTPHALNMNYDNTLDLFGGLQGLGGMPFATDGFDFNNLDYGLPTNLGNMTITDPAKQLSSKNGIMDNSQMQFNFNNGFGLDDGLSAQPQFPGGIPSSALGFPGHEEKKYKCPVIGCEKAYKNQNGLKYHKQHGHTNQKLKHNEDGSFSIVDPLTSVPYPGTVGMEKEKPYRCETCGKRYKNLNGLKYHRQHSPPCNPDLQQNNMAPAIPNGLISLQQLQQNVHSGMP